MKLNLGCGSDRMDGWVNADKYKSGATDEIVDLEVTPWPWPDNSVKEVMLRHVLEHLGQSPAVFLEIIKELYRVSKKGSKITIIVPHPRHDHYLNDPTHVRPITAEGLQMFSAKKNKEWRKKKLANTPLAEITGVDFEIEAVNYVPDEPWRGKIMRQEMTMPQLMEAAKMYNNVISEINIVLRAVK
jgi:hypothetical protein